MKFVAVATALAMMIVTVDASAGAPELRRVTLDDAFAVKSTGAIDAHPNGRLLAVEDGQGIAVLDALDGRLRHRIDGHSPQWSRDGKTLAYFSRRSGHTQLHLWTLDTSSDAQVTHLPTGVLPNDRTMGASCDPRRIAWSPDGRSIAFVSMVMARDGVPSRDTAEPFVRVYESRPGDRRSSLEAVFKNRALTDGVFAVSNYWDAFFGDDEDYAAAFSHAAIAPEAAANNVVVLDVPSGNVKFLGGTAQQYYCPVWSPDGRTLASIADLTAPTSSNDTYGALGVPRNSTVAFHDLGTGQERFLPASDVRRIRSFAWTGDGRRLHAIVETGKKLSGFTRWASLDVNSGQATMIPVPGGQAVLAMNEGVAGAVLLRLAGRFVDTLWSFDPRSNRFSPVATADWRPTAFDGLRARAVAFWADAAGFKGRLMITEPGKTPRLIYDANPQTAGLLLGEQRRLTWINKRGEEVDGLLILPPGYRTGELYPVVVDAYPRPARDDLRLGPYVEDTGQLLAAEGFIVFRPAIRAPHGSYWFSRDEAYQLQAVGAPGVAIMVDDFVSGVQALVERGFADPRRIGMFGHSNGGWVANLLLTETTDVLAAVAVSSGISNAIMMALSPDVLSTRDMDAATGGNVFDNFDDYVRLSPILRMRDIRTPLLLMVGDEDRLWVPQMISQFSVLRAEGREVTLVRYAKEGHTRSTRETAADAHRRVTEFFRQHLGRGPEKEL